MTPDKIHSRLCKLLPAQFKRIVFELGVPVALLSENVAQSTRAIELIQYLDSQGRRPDLEKLLRRRRWRGATGWRAVTAPIATASGGLALAAALVIDLGEHCGGASALPGDPRFLAVLGWSILVLVLWPARRKRSAQIELIAVSLFAVAMAIWDYWELHDRVVDPDDSFVPEPPAAHSWLDLFERRAFAEPEPARPKLVFSLVRQKTSIREFERIDDQGNKIHHYEIDPEIASGFRAGRCAASFRDRQAAARNALLRYATKLPGRDGHDLVRILEDSGADFMTLSRRRRDVVRRLAPTSGAWGTIDEHDADAILDWEVHCVGMYRPVFQLTVVNPSQDELLLTTLRYVVESFERARTPAPEAGPISGLGTERITAHAQGTRQTLEHPFRVPRHSTAALEVVIDADCKGCIYLGRLVLETSGEPLETDRFSAVLP